MNIFVNIPKGTDRDTFFTKRAMEEISRLGNVRFNKCETQLTAKQLMDEIKDVDILFTGWGSIKITKEIVESAKNLKVIAHVAGTVGPYVDGEVFGTGIKVLSGNRIFAESVAECCLGYAICALRRIERYVAKVRVGGWSKFPEDFVNEGIMDKTVGLVGFGMIAKNLVEMLKPFHCNIKVYAPDITDEIAAKYGVDISTLDEVFAESDIVSVHASMTDETVKLVSKELLGKMKDGALFINTARGRIVDEQALISELETGRIIAALDVYEQEPLPQMSKLRYLPNVLPMPHMGGPTVDRRQYTVVELSKDIIRSMNNQQMLNEVSHEQYIYMTK